MAKLQGDLGKITFDKTASGTREEVTGTKGWTFTINKDVHEITRQGQTAKKFIGGIVSGEGSITCAFNSTAADDSGFQWLIEDILEDDNSVDARFQLFPSKNDSDKKLEFKGIITGTDFGATVGEIQEVTVNFVSDGGITNDM